MTGNPQEARAQAPYSGVLAQFASGLTFADIPPQVVEKVKTCLLDALGCCVFGATLGPTRRLMEMVRAEGGNPVAALIGTPHKATATQAALVNGSAAHAFQWDEVHVGATLHPGSVAIPAALALAGLAGPVSGKRLVAALVAGYEVGIRIGLAAGSAMFKRGYHNQGTTGVFAAAATGARLLALDAEQTLHALGIAGSQAAGLMAVQEGAMAKSFHSGRASQSGVYAALLARSGFTGITNVLEAPHGGFFSSIVGSNRLEPLIEGLGSQWETLNVGHKLWPAANGSITAMETLDRIMRDHALTADDIAGICAHVSTNTLHHCCFAYDVHDVKGVQGAQMNLYYGLAVMALDRQMTPEQFSDARIRDADIGDFTRRIAVRVEPEFDGESGDLRLASRLQVQCKDGRKLEGETLYRNGSRERPIGRAEIEGKFRVLSDGVLSRQSIETTIAAIGNLEQLSITGSDLAVL